MSQKEILKWRKCDPEFSEFYDPLPYGQKQIFITVYREVWNNWNGEGIPYDAKLGLFGLKWIHKDGQRTKVYEEELQSWLDQGWELGPGPRKTKSKKRAKT